MNWAAHTHGRKDSILSCQKAIGSGKKMKYMVSAHPKNRHSYMFRSANLDVVPVIARIAGFQYVDLETQGNNEEGRADLETGLTTLDIEGVIGGANVPFYSRPVIFSTSEIQSTYDRRELIPGGFA